MRRVEDLSLQELETLLLQKRRYISERAVMRMASAERAMGYPNATLRGRDQPFAKPAPSPETWRGARGQDRYFRSFELRPLEDERSRAPRLPADQRLAASGRRPRDILLLALEIVALLGFVAILGASYQQLQRLNAEARAMQRMALAFVASPTAEPTQARGASNPAPFLTTPTATPSPSWAALAMQITPTQATITAALPTQANALLTPTRSMGLAYTPDNVLPGGERPSKTDTPRPTLSEVTRSATPGAMSPTSAPRASRRLVIATLGVEAPIVEGDTTEQLKKGIGHHTSSANPGERGNVVLSAHNDAYGEIFRDLHKLKSGDEVLVHFDGRAFRYLVRKVEIVLPTQVEVMDPTDYPVLTLITCYPYLIDTHRVVVVADLAS